MMLLYKVQKIKALSNLWLYGRSEVRVGASLNGWWLSDVVLTTGCHIYPQKASSSSEVHLGQSPHLVYEVIM